MMRHLMADQVVLCSFDVQRPVAIAHHIVRANGDWHFLGFEHRLPGTRKPFNDPLSKQRIIVCWLTLQILAASPVVNTVFVLADMAC